MNFHSNERGVAMLEAVIVTAVIGILATIVLPKLDRALDEVCADYEIRNLHTLTHYAQSASRTLQYNTFGFGALKNHSFKYFGLVILNGVNQTNSYKIRELGNVAVPKRLKPDHFLERDFKLMLSGVGSTMQFGLDGKSASSGGSITLNKGTVGKDSAVRYLVLTQYGRVRISQTPP